MLKQSMVSSVTIHNLGFYNSTTDIGNHELFLKKIGNFINITNPFRITHLSSEGIAKVYVDNKEMNAVEGMILGTDALLKSNGADIELVAADNSLLRLTGKSEFCMENTIEGVAPVIYGNVFYKKGETTIYNAHIKYRTSCWCRHTSTFIAERINNSSDMYYTLSEPLTIYEYDESGRKFKIVSLRPYQKCILSFDFKQCMRDRYTVKKIVDLDKNDIAKLYDSYLAANNWQCKHILQSEQEAI